MTAPSISPGPSLLAGPVIDPIDIDPYVEYQYVIPAKDYTSLGFEPQGSADLLVSLAGRTLTVQYVGDVPLESLTRPLVIFASSDDGTEKQTLNFRVQPASDVADIDCSASLSCDFASSSQLVAIRLTSAGSPVDIANRLAVGDALKFSQGGLPSPYVTGTTYYVVNIADSAHVKLSATAGGSPITAATTVAQAAAKVFVTTDASAVIRLGEFSAAGTSTDPDPMLGLAVDDAFTLLVSNIDGDYVDVYNFGTEAVPVTTLFVKTIVDGSHITASLTPGGSTFDAGVLGLPAILSLRLRHTALPRQFPAITSAADLEVALNEAVSYEVTTDIPADFIFVEGLPQGLTLNVDTIEGAPLESGFFPVTLLAILGGNFSMRYLVLVVASSSSSGGRNVYLDLDTGLLFDNPDVRRVVSPLIISLGDRALVVHLLNGNIAPAGADPGVLKFAANAGRAPAVAGSSTLYDGDHVVEGSVEINDVAGEGQVVIIGEDWSDARLLALFDDNQDAITLIAQFEWRNGSDPVDAFRRSRLLKVQATDTVFRTEVSPSAGSGGIGQTYIFALAVDFSPAALTTWETAVSRVVPAGIYSLAFSAAGNGVFDALDMRLQSASAFAWLANALASNYNGSSTAAVQDLLSGSTDLSEDDFFSGDNAVISNPATQAINLQVKRIGGAGALKAGSFVTLTRIA